MSAGCYSVYSGSMATFNYILAFLLFAGVLYWDVTTDYKKWKENKPVKHFKEGVLRALLLVPSILLLALPHLSLWKIVTAAAMEAAIWLLLFDGFYNRLRGFDWWFLGSVDEDDAWWDKLQRKIPLKLLKVIKISLPLVAILIYALT